MAVSSIIVASLHQYIDIVNSKSDSDATPPALFRGQRQDLPLLPKLARLYNYGLLKSGYMETEKKMLTEFSTQALCTLLEYKRNGI